VRRSTALTWRAIRLAKEVRGYESELAKHELKTEQLRAAGADPHDLKKAVSMRCELSA
jgi:hypothetical protein